MQARNLIILRRYILEFVNAVACAQLATIVVSCNDDGGRHYSNEKCRSDADCSAGRFCGADGKCHPEHENDADAEVDAGLDGDAEDGAPVRPEIFKLSAGTNAGWWFSVDGDDVVFINKAVGVLEQKLYHYDLQDGNRVDYEIDCGQELCEESRIKKASYPSINGDTVGYKCGFQESIDCYKTVIAVFDILLDRVTYYIPAVASATSQTYTQTSIQVSAGSVCWVEEIAGRTRGVAYDRTTQAVSLVTDESKWCMEAALSDRYLAYATAPVSGEGGMRANNVYLYDFESGDTITVTDDEVWQFEPKISDRYVVWVDLRNGVSHDDTFYPPLFENADVYAQDLQTGDTFQLLDHPADQVDPDVDGELFCWTDYRHGESIPDAGVLRGGEIYCLDRTVGVARRITDTEGENYAPAVTGRYVVFIHRDEGATGEEGRDLYAAKLELPLR